MATVKPIINVSGTLTELASTDTIAVSNLGSGTPSNTSFLRGDGTWDANVGYKNLPQNTQNANYTLVLADSGKHIYHSDTTARVYTIPANASVAFDVGTVIAFINDGTASVSIAITTDTLVLAGAGTTGTRSLASNGMATAIKIATTRWIINGTGLT